VPIAAEIRWSLSRGGIPDPGVYRFEVTQEEYQKILGGNAKKLLGL